MRRIRILVKLFFVALIGSIVLLELAAHYFVYRYHEPGVDHRMTPGKLENINSDGIRSLAESESFREEDLNIVMLGDSFVYGFGLPNHETVPFLLEEKARTLHPEQQINVANFGWVSASPVLSYRLLKDIGRLYKPDVVLLAIDMTDFHDDIKYQKMIENKGLYKYLNWAAEILPATTTFFTEVTSRIEFFQDFYDFPTKRFFATAAPLEETREDYSYIRKSIEDINAFASEELNARFVLFIFPRTYQYSDKESPNNWEAYEYDVLGPYAHEPFKYFEQISDDVAYPIYSLLPYFQNTKVFPTSQDLDPHWILAGAQIAANAIYNLCDKEGCFDNNSEMPSGPLAREAEPWVAAPHISRSAAPAPDL